MKLSLVSLVIGALLAAPTWADSNASNWTLRVGAANVSPNDSSGAVLGNDGVAVDDAWGLGISLDIPMNDRWSFEVLAASPFSHDITGTGAINGLAVGKVKHLPPTFSALYYLNAEKTWHLGFGINYTTFLEDDADDALVQALNVNSADLELDDSFGYSLKVGFDIPMNESWSFNGNLYYMDIDTTADVYLDGAYATSVDVEIDPFVVMLGVSTQF
ncbi:OmpW/AlkL family protein [Pleionea litopenaei]|uniref:OmpW family outer membrane protein n=1 Tax=Pleionea litopenaei TaxID=3070815 RepID=A0AA51RV91_9GAMM|nr:OmpW family outer membrane protein [Pleionea sp. HL-JVS1]WMS88129.1 OmpW family outer membrane protein [Pleionea sp. HL-JVS1]